MSAVRSGSVQSIADWNLTGLHNRCSLGQVSLAFWFSDSPFRRATDCKRKSVLRRASAPIQNQIKRQNRPPIVINHLSRNQISECKTDPDCIVIPVLHTNRPLLKLRTEVLYWIESVLHLTGDSLVCLDDLNFERLKEGKFDCL